MDIADIMVRMEEERAEAAAAAKETASKIIDALKEAGIPFLSVAFAGCGDSGSVEGMYSEEGGWEPVIDQSSDLYTPIEAWAYQLLSGTGVDWYNNDGGQGYISIDVENRTYEYEVSYNVTETEVGASDTVIV